MGTAPEIFISYRNVSLGWAVTLDQALRAAYGDERVFRAGRSIPPGDLYEEVILRAAAGCRLMLCIVGPTWLAAGPDGVRLVDREQDFVRREIGAALGSGAHIVPVLVENAPRMSGSQLPDDIARFGALQSEQLRGQAVDDDLKRILEHLATIITPLGAAAHPGPPPDAVPRTSGFTPFEDGAPYVSPGKELAPRELAELVENLLRIPEFAGPGFRDELTAMLDPGITGTLRRSSRPRSEALNLVTTCARFAGGLLALLHALQVCAGDLPEVRRFHASVASVL
ncbi:effector-associated domain 2-containing protein [Kineosporia babensis]|uniref:Toll/interleukin-1 receptor domain-containing protein n=1 Tax=Kineosporia babensis TaxID=499548 RepID=A0A9X1NBA3_9ACTN|nr:TIR domain-containing protein [Kineosporia babensis]MCD5310958.1 toll/interleukin-1 receptor domain-containing protein [Kineosporia babensis]